MKRLVFLVLLVVLGLVFLLFFPKRAPKHTAWPSPEDLARVTRPLRPLAESSLQEFRGMVDTNDFQDLGFETIEEARSATLAEPLVVYRITLATLRDWQTNRTTDDLLDASSKVIYPVAADGQVRSSIILQNARGRWEASDYGYASLATLLADARQRVAKDARLPFGQLFAVEVRALNRFFIGHRPGAQAFLTPVVSEPALSLDAGQPLPAAEALARLVPLARSQRGYPGEAPVPKSRPRVVRPAGTNLAR